MKNELLVKAAKELDKVLYEEPYIDFKQSPDELTKALMEASKELEDDDKLSEETIDILAQIWEDKEGKLTVEVCEVFWKLGIIPPATEDKDEQPEDAEVVPETDGLAEEIEQARRLKDLKDIAKSNDEFKLIRGKLNGFKEIDDLRDAMLEILDGIAPEEPEKEEAPKAEKKAEPKATMKIVPKDEEKPVKKAETKKTEKKETGITRQTAVFIAIRKICKKGGSVNDIAEEANSVYMKNNPESKGISKLQNMSNVVRHSILALVEFEVLSEKNGKYSFQ